MKFSDLKFINKKNRPCSFQAKIHFKNGYGASIIKGPTAFSDSKRPYEVAVLKNNELCYETHITDDVIGYQTELDVEKVLAQIKALPKEP